MGKTRKKIIRSLSVLFLFAVLFVSAVHVSASETEDASLNEATRALSSVTVKVYATSVET